MYINKHNKVVFNFTHTKYDVRFRKKINDEAFHRLVISPFEIKDNYDSFPTYQSPYGECNLDNCVINTRELVKCDLTQIEFKFFLSMLTNLEENTNRFECTLNNISAAIGCGAKPYTFVTNLVAKGLIERTDCKYIYIVNHNIAFKGDLNKFREDYLRVFGTEKPLYNEHKQVVIKYN